MAWAWNKGSGGRGDPWSIKEPVSKRRRTEKRDSLKEQKMHAETDDWGDDSLELTQAELENIDIMASQAMEENEKPVASTSKSSPHEEPSFAMPSHPTRLLSNKSTSSSDSSLRPASLSSRTSVDTSSSLSSHSSVNGHTEKETAALGEKLREKETEVQKVRDENYRFSGEIQFLRDSLHKQEAELERLRAERNHKVDLEKEAQSHKERQLQFQVDRLTSQSQFKEREFQELQAQLKALEAKLKKQGEKTEELSGLGEQLPQASQRGPSPKKILVKPSPPSKQKQQQLREEEEGSSQRPQFPTPFSFLQQNERAATSSPSTSRNNSSKPAGVITPVMSVTGASVSAISSASENVSVLKLHPKSRRLYLNCASNKDRNSGSRIVSHLLHASGNPEGSGGQQLNPQGLEGHQLNPEGSGGHGWNPGLAGLLHVVSTSCTVAGLTYTRTKDATLFSPLKPAKSVVRGDAAGGMMEVVSAENFHLAIEGLKQLLEESGMSRDTPAWVTGAGEDTSSKGLPETKNRMESSLLNKPIHPGNSGNGPNKSTISSLQQGTASPQQTKFDSELSLPAQPSHAGAVLLLPLLTDYLHHYNQLLETSSRRTPLPAKPSSLSATQIRAMSSLSSLESSRSYDSSLDSLSSCVQQLLHDGKIYAASMESYAVTALRCLSLLVRMCPVVGSAVLDSHKTDLCRGLQQFSSVNTSSSNVDTDVGSVATKKSATDADDEKSTSSSEVRVISGVTPTLELTTSAHTRGQPSTDQSLLLELLIRLAGQDLEDGLSSAAVMQESLKVLTYLCQGYSLTQLQKLNLLFTRGTLACALKQLKHTGVLVWAQKLLIALARNDQMLSKMCSKSENCPLFLMHRVSTSPVEVGQTEMIPVYQEYLRCVSCLLSQCRSECCAFLNTSCPCSEELVPGIILAAYKLLTHFSHGDTGRSNPLLTSLGQGVLLLHTLAHQDTAFAHHHSHVQLQYVRVLAGIGEIMRKASKDWEFHLSALDDLCGFEGDYADSSQGSEGEERMDQS